jgi:mannan endo-1,4-beta-mannosidase
VVLTVAIAAALTLAPSPSSAEGVSVPDVAPSISLVAATSSQLASSVNVAPTTALAPIRSGFVTRSGSQLLLDGALFRFAGANEYYLGLDDNIQDAGGNPTYPTKARIDDALQSAVSTGATVIRSHTLGISVGCSMCLEPRLGVFNDVALVSADYAIYRAGQLHLKLIIPLTDQWRYYHGGESTFTAWAGYPNSLDPTATAANNSAQRAAESHFYSDPAVVSTFKAYVAHLLDHVNPYTGLAYKNDPTIMAWETGNELWTAPPTWTQNVASFIKHTLGARQLVADGSAANGMTVANAAIDAPDVDIVGGHFYPVDVSWMTEDAAIAAAHGKVYVVEEFDWTDPVAIDALIAAVQSDPNISGDLYWTLMPHLETGAPEPHGDGYAMYYPALDKNSASVLAALTAHARWMQ